MRPASSVIGIVSPGVMGAGIARALPSDARIVATIAERSSRTEKLAREASGLELLQDLNAVVSVANLLLLVVPPEHAQATGRAVAAAAERTGAKPLVAELNAVAPETARTIAAGLAEAGLDTVDGSISGPPPREGSTTRIYLSGERAHEVAALTARHVEWVVVGSEVGIASAVKMCTASVYKGSVALLTQALRTAHRHGVSDTVVEDLTASFPHLLDRAGLSIALAASKAERYVPEMQEIAQTQAAAGLPRELFDGVAEVYAELARTPIARTAPEDVDLETQLGDVLRDLDV